MPGRSIAGQATMLQKETTPGTALVTAMRNSKDSRCCRRLPAKQLPSKDSPAK
jgi:hypothetical protein